MSKDKFAVPIQHQVVLRTLLAERAVAQAALQARASSIREYLKFVLEEAGLDPQLFGIDQTISKFVPVELPKPQGTVAQATPSTPSASPDPA